MYEAKALLLGTVSALHLSCCIENNMLATIDVQAFEKSILELHVYTRLSLT